MIANAHNGSRYKLPVLVEMRLEFASGSDRMTGCVEKDGEKTGAEQP